MELAIYLGQAKRFGCKEKYQLKTYSNEGNWHLIWDVMKEKWY